jgi:CheY-like chemotaxis protein
MTNATTSEKEGKSILVIEDDPILRNLLSHALLDKYKTFYANDGAIGVEMFNQYKPSLILLDLTLPVMDGFTVLETIRNSGEEGKGVPVIVVSNLGQQSDKDRASALGANDYVVKAEVEVDEIIQRAEKLLQNPA